MRTLDISLVLDWLIVSVLVGKRARITLADDDRTLGILLAMNCYIAGHPAQPSELQQVEEDP